MEILIALGFFGALVGYSLDKRQRERKEKQKKRERFL